MGFRSNRATLTQISNKHSIGPIGPIGILKQSGDPSCRACICVGFTYKPKSSGEEQPPRDALVLDSRTNQNLWARTNFLMTHMYGIHVQTKIPGRGATSSRSICIGFTYKVVRNYTPYCTIVHSSTQHDKGHQY